MAPALIEWMVKKCVNWITAKRVLFVAVLVLQIGILAVAYMGSYLTTEKGISGQWLLVSLVLILLVLSTWVIILIIHEIQLSKLWIVWAVYLATLMLFISFIFGYRTKLNKNRFWGPNNLKITIYLTPVIALLLVLTARDAREYVYLNIKLFLVNVRELFELVDTIEVLAIVISSAEPHSKSLPDGMVVAIVVLAALSLALSPLQLAEKLDGNVDYPERGNLYLFGHVVKNLLINFGLMIVRLIALVQYEQEVLPSIIFIFKNALMIGSYCYYKYLV